MDDGCFTMVDAAVNRTVVSTAPRWDFLVKWMSRWLQRSEGFIKHEDFPDFGAFLFFFYLIVFPGLSVVCAVSSCL